MKKWMLISILFLMGLSVILIFTVHWTWGVLLVLSIALLFIWFYDHSQTHYAIHRNFPVSGRFRDIAGWMRPKIYQYFVESDTEGRPFDKTLRDVVFHRSSMAEDTAPFGTQLDLYQEGYEWMNQIFVFCMRLC